MGDLELLQKISSSNGIFVNTSTLLIYVVVLIVAVSRPLLSLLKEFKNTAKDNSKSDAESALYKQLQQQILSNTQAIESLFMEKTKYQEKSFRLELEVNELKQYKEMITSMKLRLDEKDRIIEIKINEIKDLTNTILEMKDKLHSLELRVIEDERLSAQFMKGDTHD